MSTTDRQYESNSARLQQLETELIRVIRDTMIEYVYDDIENMSDSQLMIHVLNDIERQYKE